MWITKIKSTPKLRYLPHIDYFGSLPRFVRLLSCPMQGLKLYWSVAYSSEKLINNTKCDFCVKIHHDSEYRTDVKRPKLALYIARDKAMLVYICTRELRSTHAMHFLRTSLPNIIEDTWWMKWISRPLNAMKQCRRVGRREPGVGTNFWGPAFQKGARRPIVQINPFITSTSLCTTESQTFRVHFHVSCINE